MDAAALAGHLVPAGSMFAFLAAPAGPPAVGCARTTGHSGRTRSGPSPRWPTWRGRRLRLRYRGVARNHAWLKRRTAALNLRNLIGKGLARRHGAWALAT